MTGVRVWVRRNAYLACFEGASPALVLAGCALVGGLFDVVRLERIDGRLRCSCARCGITGGKCECLRYTSCFFLSGYFLSLRWLPWVHYRAGFPF
jgi:hypothetical protein